MAKARTSRAASKEPAAQVPAVAAETQIATREDVLGGMAMETFRDLYVKDSTDAEFELFMATAQTLNLNPIKKEIHFLKFGSHPGKPHVGYEVYIARAELTGKLDGWSADLLQDPKSGKVVGAKVTIHRKDWGKPFVWTVNMDEFNTGQQNWKRMPGFMCKKVCIAQAFRLCFTELASLPYIREEIDHDNPLSEGPATPTSIIEAEAQVVPPQAEPAPAPVQQAPAPQAEPVAETAPAPEPAAAAPAPVQQAPAPQAAPQAAPQGGGQTLKLQPGTLFIVQEHVDGIAGQFSKFGVTVELMEQVLGDTRDKWTAEHVSWLREKWHCLNQSKGVAKEAYLTPKMFGELSYEEMPF